MLRSVIASALRRRSLVFALASLLVVSGVWSARHAELDVFPDFVPPQVVVQTESPGFAPEQVEQLVTQPVESALGGLPGMVSLRSESIAGLSVVSIVFTEDHQTQTGTIMGTVPGEWIWPYRHQRYDGLIARLAPAPR